MPRYRLIGDDSLPPEKQYTKFIMRSYGRHLFVKVSPLLPSGLNGPVNLFLGGEGIAASKNE